MSDDYAHLPDIGQYLPQFRQFAAGHVQDFVNARDRAQHLLGNKQPYILGAGREELLREFLRKVLPGGVRVDSGVVYGFERAANSGQIDILVWDAVHFPTVFRAESFVIVPPEAVIAAVSVRSGAAQNDYKEAVSNLSSLWEVDFAFRRRAGLPAIAKFGVFYDAPRKVASAQRWLTSALKANVLKQTSERARITSYLENVNPKDPADEVVNYFHRLLPQLFVHLEPQAMSFFRGWGPPDMTVSAAAQQRFKRLPYLYTQKSELTSSLEKLVYALLAASLKAFGRFGGSLLSAWGDFDPQLHVKFGDAGELIENTGLPILEQGDLPDGAG